MNFRTTYILLGIVVVALAALGIYVLSSGDKRTNPATEGYLLKALRAANVQADDIATVDIERPGQTPEKISFTRDGKNWVMIAPAKARTDSAAVDSVVSGILNAKTEKSADLSTSLSAHGLDNPPLKVTLGTGKITETISLGNVTIGGDRAVVYVLTSDRPDKPQAARRSDFSALFKPDAPRTAGHAGQMAKSVADFRPLKVIGDGVIDPVNQVRSFAIRSGKDELALFREPGGNWTFRLPRDFGEATADAADLAEGPKSDPGAITSVRQLLNTITSIQPAERKAIIENPGDLSKYGLDMAKNNPLQIDLSRSDGIKEALFVGGPIKGDANHEKWYARHEVDDVVYEVPGDPVKKLQAIMANKNALRDRSVVRLSPQRIDAIDIDVGGDKIELRRLPTGWHVYDADGKGRPARNSAVTELLNRLTAKQLAVSFPPTSVPEDKRGFAKPAVEIKLWENGILPDEKADAKVDPKADPKAEPKPKPKPKVSPTPSTTLIFGLKDVGDVVFARRLSGESKADFFLPAEAFQLAARGRLDYLDANLKPFGADAVLKLTIGHGKETIEVERPDDGKPTAQTAWKITSPERLKGRSADAFKILDLVNQLSFLRPTRVVSDKVTDDVLNRLEVNPASPRLKVTAKVKDLGERIFYFGGDVGTEKKSVYLKPGDLDLVVEVDRGAFDLFQKADVQDTVVHKIDKAKIKAIKITGWQEVLGMPTTLEIERKDGKWTLKSGGMFELDPAKVDSLLNDLTLIKAEAFVVYKDGPKPEHNLDVTKNALAVELTMDSGDPVKMVISAPNKDGKVFAASSVVPGDVFTMLDRFTGVRAKPAALKKD